MIELDSNFTFSNTYRVTIPATIITTLSSSRNKEANIFSKGIKRDSTLFLVLKEYSKQDLLKLNLIAIARAQDVAEFLDPSYITVISEETELFDEKQKFLYSIFYRVFKNNKGKFFVRQYEDDYDAQTIFTKLVNYYTSSTFPVLHNTRLAQSCILYTVVYNFNSTIKSKLTYSYFFLLYHS